MSTSGSLAPHGELKKPPICGFFIYAPKEDFSSHQWFKETNQQREQVSGFLYCGFYVFGFCHIRSTNNGMMKFRSLPISPGR